MLSHGARKLAYLTGTALLLIGASGPAFAQNAPEPRQESAGAETEANQVEDIVVTGSRIRGVAPVGSSVVSLGREEIASSGTTTTAELLKQIPQITAIGFNAEGSTGPAAASNITRATGPNLRGIGPTATLTLLDGHRVSAAGTQGQVVDPSFIPPLALERVEVIADGASAIYGSDAVAGVVNLIPRKNFSGFEGSSRIAMADGYSEYQVGGLFGFDWTGGHFVAAADYVDSTELKASDRSFVTDDRRAFGGANGLATNCSTPGTATIGGVTYALPGGDGRGVRRSSLTPGTSNTCDTVDQNWLLPDTERFSGYLYADQRLSDSIMVYAQGFYSRRDFQAIRGQPFLTNSVVPVTNPFRPADVPATTAVTVSYSLLPDLGPGFAIGYGETYQGLAGIEAMLGEFRIELSGSYGQGEDEEDRRTLNTFFVNQALADSNPATALNLFGGPGTNNPATLERILSGRSVIRGASTLKTAELNIDGPIFTIPGGAVRIAAGGEYRDEALEAFQLSTSAATGGFITTTGGNDRTVKAIYGELFIPLFSEENAIAGFQRLDLSIAGRWEEYSDFGNTSNPKIGVNWSPVEGFTARGSYGTSFRAPGLAENDPRSSGAGIYQNANATLANGTRVFTVALGGGNPDLQPETATTWSAGFDFEPVSIPRLRVSMTYFDVAYENQIVDGFGRQGTYINNQAQYPNLVAAQGGAAFATLRALIQASGFTASPAIDYNLPNLVLIDARRVNVGQVQTNGLDLDVSYRHVTDNSGAFAFGASATQFLEYLTAETNQASVDRLNTLAYPAEFLGRAYVGWEGSGFRTRATVNYVNSYTNANSTLVRNVDAYTTLDLDLTYEFGPDAGAAEGVRLGLNVRNLTNEEPPLVDTGGAYDASKASALGRVLAFSISKRW